jgi:hypothetical protein
MHDSAALTIEPGGVSPGQSALRSLTSKASNQGDGAASTITFILIDLHSLEICRSRSSGVLVTRFTVTSAADDPTTTVGRR